MIARVVAGESSDLNSTYETTVSMVDRCPYGVCRKTSDSLVKYRPFLESLPLSQILQYLKKHGQRLDTEIAKDTGIALETVRQRVAGLAAAGEVITCDVTRFENGKAIRGWVCRVSGYTPPPAPGRKAKPAAVAS